MPYNVKDDEETPDFMKLSPTPIPQSSDFSVESGATTPKSMPIPRETMAPSPSAPDLDVFNPPADRPAVSPPPPIPRAAPTSPLPGMPPTVSPDVIANYLNSQKASIDKYGGDAQMAQQQLANNSRNSLGYKLADAGKGFADALMMGVARAGNPNWQGQFEQQQNALAAENMGTLRGANESNLKQTEAKMSLDKMDPASPTSKAAQAAYAPLFQKLGYNPSRIQAMSASDITTAIQLMTEYGGKEVEAMIKKYELDMEGKKIDATLQNIESETQNRKEERALESKKLRLEHPILSSFEGNQTSTATEHPQADEARSWALSHQSDPRAKQILQRLGK